MVEHVHVLRQELIKRLGAMATPEPLTIEQKAEMWFRQLIRVLKVLG
jgi:hypothetical protein